MAALSEMMRAGLLGTGRRAMVGALSLLGACAGYSGSNLKPGISALPEIEATMGVPAQRWTFPDGGEQLAYPRGPAGTQTFMVFVGADGRLLRIEGVLDTAHFARIEPGRSDKAAVLRLLGPPQPQWTAYFKARDELVWEWRFCDSWNQVARFDVLFDATTGVVRTTYQRPERVGWRSDTLSCGH